MALQQPPSTDVAAANAPPAAKSALSEAYTAARTLFELAGVSLEQYRGERRDISITL